MRVRLGILLLLGCHGSSAPPAEAPDGQVPNPTDARAGDAATVPPDGSTIPPDATVVPLPPDATTGDGCATPPTGAWAGAMGFYASGAGSSERFDADVTWTLASTDACVDHYTPSGTMTPRFSNPCDPTYDPPTGAIAATDGELTIDRSTAPATFRVTGETRFDTVEHGCGDTTPTTIDGVWADDDGIVSGDLIDGAVNIRWTSPFDFSWHLRRTGASFPPPTGCAEPPTETWRFTGSVLAAADVLWTRTATDGCVDTFAPSGTAHDVRPPGCTTWSVVPPSGPIANDAGALTVDRSTNPPTYEVHGQSEWEATVICNDSTYTGFAGGPWAAFVGAYDGDATGGGANIGSSDPRAAWTLSR